MTFRGRILLALGTLAVLPVLLLGGLSYRANREELQHAVGGAQAQAATEMARACERFVVNRAQALRLSATYIPFDALSGAELQSVLHIPFRQLPDLTALTVLDATGMALTDAVVERPATRGRDAERRGDTAADLQRFARAIPLEAAGSAEIAVGPPYLSASSGEPRVAIAVRAGSDGDRVLAAELSLADLDARLRALSTDGAAFLVDPVGKPFTSGAPAADLSDEERALVAQGRTASGALTRVVKARGVQQLAAYAPVDVLGWGVVLEQPTSRAFRAADRIRRYTAFWAVAALVLAVILGVFMARTLGRPVAQLSAAASALTEGRYDVKVAAEGRDELAQLGAAFNHMAREVRRRDEEIRRWNTELQERVTEKTAELRLAEDQIARARRLAAMGSLGAGVAHGLNNPLTSLMGLVALARRDVGSGSAAGQLLGEALEEARRVGRVVDDLKRLTDLERSSAGRTFPPAQPVRAALERRRPGLVERGILVAEALDGDVPPVQGDPGQIEELVSHLLDNAAEAMPEGGRLELSLSGVDGEAVRLTVSDTGCGIPPDVRERIFDPFFTTKAAPGAGLGLSLLHGIVEAHHGQVRVESAPGQGARFDVLLPAAARAAHLA